VPNLEYWVTSVPVLEYVLEKRFPSSGDGGLLAPEDMIEFAKRIGDGCSRRIFRLKIR